MGGATIVRRLRALLVAGGLALCGGIPAPAQAAVVLGVDKTIGKVSGWSIGLSKGLNGCVAAATYQDQTTVWLGFDGSRDEAFLAFTNPRWKSIAPDRAYGLTVLTGRGRWRGTFSGLSRDGDGGLFASGLKKTFVVDLARAGGLDLVFEGKSIARLSMSGSSDALGAMFDCQKTVIEAKAVPETPRPDGDGKPKGDGVKTGTGFFVSDKGHVLTNDHVVKGCSEIVVAKVGAPGVRAEVVAADATNDLAVLSTSFSNPSVPALALRARVGDSVYVYGFPLGGMLTTTGNFTVGNVTATAGLHDDTRHLQVSAPIQPGNSGGPLVDQYGAILGVVVSRINDMYVAERADVIPQNVNFAIKSTIALSFLDANAIPPAAGIRSPTPLDPASIAEQARLFTVRIACR